MLPLDEIYRPEWVTIYSHLLEVPSICSILLYPFVMYTVLFKAPDSMQVYKWMLANAITTSFLLELVMCFGKPYFLLPLYMGRYIDII